MGSTWEQSFDNLRFSAIAYVRKDCLFVVWNCVFCVVMNYQQISVECHWLQNYFFHDLVLNGLETWNHHRNRPTGTRSNVGFSYLNYADYIYYKNFTSETCLCTRWWYNDHTSSEKVYSSKHEKTDRSLNEEFSRSHHRPGFKRFGFKSLRRTGLKELHYRQEIQKIGVSLIWWVVKTRKCWFTF